MNNDLTQDRLKELLRYNPETGAFTWLVCPGRRVRAGDIAGSTNNGYRVIQVRGRSYKAHRLAWLYVHGVWPPAEVDHRHGVRSDNRISGLRLATRQENGRNLKRLRSNTTGFTGVHWRKDRQCWQARIGVGGRYLSLGYFDSPEAASAAYEARATQLFGEFKRAA